MIINMTSNSDYYVRGSAIPGYDQYCPITPINDYDLTHNDFDEQDLIESPGFLIIHLGSIEREHTLEAAASALHNSMWSLFSACNIPADLERIRTTIELSKYMEKFCDNYSHIILIGHGTPDGIPFLDKSEPIGGSELSNLLCTNNWNSSKQVISLCCHSGCEKLAQELSESTNIKDVLAPNDVFDMRWAVHFVTGYFLMYTERLSIDDAALQAARNSGGAPICIWRDGRLVGTCAK